MTKDNYMKLMMCLISHMYVNAIPTNNLTADIYSVITGQITEMVFNCKIYFLFHQPIQFFI